MSFIFIIYIAFFLSLNFFSPENLVTMIVGGFVSFGLTNWIKTQTGAMGFGATVLALAVSVVVALVAVVVSMFLSADGFSWDKAAGSAIQVFAVATIAYKSLLADKQ